MFFLLTLCYCAPIWFSLSSITQILFHACYMLGILDYLIIVWYSRDRVFPSHQFIRKQNMGAFVDACVDREIFMKILKHVPCLRILCCFYMQYDMKLLAIDIPMKSGPDQRLFLIGDEDEYRVGGGLISQLRDPVVKAMAATKEFDDLDRIEEEEDAERELQEAERKHREEIEKIEKVDRQ